MTKDLEIWPKLVHRSARELEPTDAEIAKVVTKITAVPDSTTQTIKSPRWVRRNLAIALLAFLLAATATAAATGLLPLGVFSERNDQKEEPLDTESPEARALAFYASLVDGDPVEACSLLLAELPGGIRVRDESAGCVLLHTQYIEALRRMGKIEAIAHPLGATTRFKGDTATVSIAFENGRLLGVDLIRLGRRWYVSGFSLP